MMKMAIQTMTVRIVEVKRKFPLESYLGTFTSHNRLERSMIPDICFR